MPEPVPTFGQQLVAKRKMRKMSQHILARQSGISRTALRKLELDEELPRMRTVMSLALALRCKFEFEFAGKKWILQTEYQ